MPISENDKIALDKLFAAHKGRYGGCKEDYFAVQYLVKKFGCSIEDVAQNVSFGNHDFGIDAYYIDRKARNLYLYQFKWSESHSLFKESLDRLNDSGLERIFGNPSPNSKEADLLHKLRSDLRENHDLIQRVYVEFIFKGRIEAVEASAGLGERREVMGNKGFLVQDFFGRPVEMIVRFVADKATEPDPQLTHTFRVEFSEKASVRNTQPEAVMHVGFVEIGSLVSIYQELGQKFLSRNIRAELAADNSPNRKIRQSLSDIVLNKTQPPEVFAILHNGVSLAAEKAVFSEGYADLINPRLLNGAQTISSVKKFLEDNKNHPKLRTSDNPLAKIRVLARIIEHAPMSEFVTTVTIANNQQNPVMPWQLRANDRIQCDLQDKFAASGIFYSRQENSFENMTKEELEEMGIHDEAKDIKIRPLAQTFAAVQGQIDRMTRLADIFESANIYNDTFRASYLKADTRKIVLAYKIHKLLGPVITHLEELRPEYMIPVVRTGRNLIWSLLIQALLNDKHLTNYSEHFGQGLVSELAFKETLKDLARKRVFPVLKTVANYPDYKDKVSQGKLAFLRTKDCFQLCMKDAHERWDWDKKTF